jgi:ADP-ribose pyrophosphatase YjhB (NUDIX family)
MDRGTAGVGREECRTAGGDGAAADPAEAGADAEDAGASSKRPINRPQRQEPMTPIECSTHKLVADILVHAENHVLLVRYIDTRNYDGQEGWFLPDDYLAHGEHPRDAAVRILRDQAGVEAEEIALTHIESFGGEDGQAWHLIFHHRLDLPSTVPVEARGNVRVAKWFPLGALPEPGSVAHHGWALEVIRASLSIR